MRKGLTQVVAAACLLCAVARGAGVSPGQAEQRALQKLKGQIRGQIVWESNRGGSWDLYTMNADGTGARRLTDGPEVDTQGFFSPDGKLIAFTRAARNSTSVWTMDSDGSNVRKLLDDGSDPRWRKGGRALQFRRRPDRSKKHWRTWEYDFRTGEERLLFPPGGMAFEADIFWAMGNDEGTRFVGWSPRPRGIWVWSPDGTVQAHVSPGCEGQVAADQRYAYGVHSTGDLVRFDLSDGGGMFAMLQRDAVPQEWEHTFFPFVSPDSNWLLYGACPSDQHDHQRSDYEIFVVKLQDWRRAGEPVRLTFNTHTDRWPRIHVASDSSPATLPAGAYDVAGNRGTNPPPKPLPIFTFAGEDAGPEFGGTWGLWPQTEGCRAETTFMAGEDAEGWGGGSMRIVYDITAAPRSFSLWMTPGFPETDLSAHDRFVIQARGDVSSFTLVVKDGNAGDPDSPEGIADYVVDGVRKEWRRFELPFDGFRPRKAGGVVDWRTINHVGIAAIAPQNPLSGTLHVDNLGTVAGPGARLLEESVPGGGESDGPNGSIQLHDQSGPGAEPWDPPAGRKTGVVTKPTRTREEVEELIETLGRKRPDWWASVPLRYPKTLLLTWPRPKHGEPWTPGKYPGQYVISVVNPNPSRWKEGAKLFHHMLTVNQDNREGLASTMDRLGHIYGNLLGDYARAAFWLRKASKARYPTEWLTVALANCYWQLGNAEMAKEALRKSQASNSTAVKLWAEMGDLETALALVEKQARWRAPEGAYLAGGDACRSHGRYGDAIAYYNKVLALPVNRREPEHIKKCHTRARASIDAIRVFENLDLGLVADGVYQGSALGFRGNIEVAVEVRRGRIESVKVIRHKEDWFFSSLTDIPDQIVRNQGLRGVDAVTSATVTSTAIVNAAAKALAAGME